MQTQIVQRRPSSVQRSYFCKCEFLNTRKMINCIIIIIALGLLIASITSFSLYKCSFHVLSSKNITILNTTIPITSTNSTTLCQTCCFDNTKLGVGCYELLSSFVIFFLYCLTMSKIKNRQNRNSDTEEQSVSFFTRYTNFNLWSKSHFIWLLIMILTIFATIINMFWMSEYCLDSKCLDEGRWTVRLGTCFVSVYVIIMEVVTNFYLFNIKNIFCKKKPEHNNRPESIPL